MKKSDNDTEACWRARRIPALRWERRLGAPLARSCRHVALRFMEQELCSAFLWSIVWESFIFICIFFVCVWGGHSYSSATASFTLRFSPSHRFLYLLPFNKKNIDSLVMMASFESSSASADQAWGTTADMKNTFPVIKLQILIGWFWVNRFDNRWTNSGKRCPEHFQPTSCTAYYNLQHVGKGKGESNLDLGKQPDRDSGSHCFILPIWKAHKWTDS